MAFCPNCGQQVGDKAVVCVHCGSQIKSITTVKQDSNSFGWFCLGYCIPIVGFILWLVWMSETPMRARRLGFGALFSVFITPIIIFIIYVIYFLVIMAIIGSTGSYY